MTLVTTSILGDFDSESVQIVVFKLAVIFVAIVVVQDSDPIELTFCQFHKHLTSIEKFLLSNLCAMTTLGTKNYGRCPEVL